MTSSIPADMLKSLSEILFRVGERKRLKAQKEHNKEREEKVHSDLLSKVQEDIIRSEHQHRMEHHGHEFWTYYYPGEKPDAVLLNKPIINHEYGTEAQKMAIESHMLDPEFAAYDPLTSDPGASQEWLAKKRWTGLLWVAEAAMTKENYKEAESEFRQALDETKNFHVSEIGLSRTLNGLAKCLCKLDKHEEAEAIYLRVLEIDEHIVGYGNTNMEEEFYTIARHLIDNRHYEEVIEVYLDLIDRLTQSVGRRDPMVARCLNELGLVYCKQLRFKEAEPVLRRAVEILKQFTDSRDKPLAVTMQNLAKVLDELDQHEEAESLLEAAIKILEKSNALKQ